MDIDDRTKRGRGPTLEAEGKEEKTEQGNKKNSMGEKVHTKVVGSEPEAGISIVPLRQSWSMGTEQKKKEEEKRKVPIRPQKIVRPKLAPARYKSWKLWRKWPSTTPREIEA